MRWLIQFFWFLVVIVAAAAAVSLRGWLPYVIGGFLALGFGIWILTSTLWPSTPNRKCPRCGQAGLVKIRRHQPGVRCERCDFRDETLHVAYLDDW